MSTCSRRIRCNSSSNGPSKTGVATANAISVQASSPLAWRAVTRVLSCIQPTGEVHLGNYLGALRNWVAGQHDADAFHGIVDLHALTVTEQPGVIGDTTVRLAAILFAIGLDPDVATVFVQSHVVEHNQLCWVMECTASFGELSRMTQFKDKSAKREGDFVSAGTFTYPILQAADILLYDAQQVPVGEDQRQHLELTRDLAQRFNTRFGETFVVPEPHIVKESAKILDLQIVDKQMAKSIGGAGCLWLLEEPDVLAKKIKRAVTDTETDVRFDPEKKPGVSNLLRILATLTDRRVEDVVPDYTGKGYGALKADVADAMVAFATPFRERAMTLLADEPALDAVLADGAARARKVAGETLNRAYELVGFLPPEHTGFAHASAGAPSALPTRG